MAAVWSRGVWLEEATGLCWESSEERAIGAVFVILLKIQTVKSPLSREGSILRHILRNVVSV